MSTTSAMPSPSVITVTTAKVGVLRSMRTQKRTSFHRATITCLPARRCSASRCPASQSRLWDAPFRFRDYSASMKIPFTQRLRDGKPLIGTILSTASREIAEVIQTAGFDWVFIDGEHGAIEPSQVQGLLQTLAAGPLALVRLPEL